MDRVLPIRFSGTRTELKIGTIEASLTLGISFAKYLIIFSGLLTQTSWKNPQIWQKNGTKSLFSTCFKTIYSMAPETRFLGT